jgi:hypothetical protein
MQLTLAILFASLSAVLAVCHQATTHFPLAHITTGSSKPRAAPDIHHHVHWRALHRQHQPSNICSSSTDIKQDHYNDNKEA